MSSESVPPWFRPIAAAEGDVGLDANGALVVTVSIQALVALLDPEHADPWNVGGVRRDQINAALRDGRLRDENPEWADARTSVKDSTAHAERIAWLVRCGWDVTERFRLDVDQYGGVGLDEGNHRLHALAYLGLDGPITVELTGYIDIAECLLGIAIPTPEEPGSAEQRV